VPCWWREALREGESRRAAPIGRREASMGPRRLPGSPNVWTRLPHSRFPTSGLASGGRAARRSRAVVLPERATLGREPGTGTGTELLWDGSRELERDYSGTGAGTTLGREPGREPGAGTGAGNRNAHPNRDPSFATSGVRSCEGGATFGLGRRPVLGTVRPVPLQALEAAFQATTTRSAPLSPPAASPPRPGPFPRCRARLQRLAAWTVPAPAGEEAQDGLRVAGG
jgi:hypothetical protein